MVQPNKKKLSIKKQRLYGKKKLRVFCEQFGYDMPYPTNIVNHQIK